MNCATCILEAIMAGRSADPEGVISIEVSNNGGLSQAVVQVGGWTSPKIPIAITIEQGAAVCINHLYERT